MYKRLLDGPLPVESFHENHFENGTSSHSTASTSTMDVNEIKTECTDFTSPDTDISDTAYTSFIITEITGESTSEYTVSVFEDGNLKQEPVENETDEEDSMEYECVNQIPSNTLTKEELIIECEPNVDSSKKRKKYQYRWQEDTVFQRESDALDVIRKEGIWTNSNERSKACSKFIYTCRNLNSSGSPCDAGLHLQFSQKDSSVTLFRSTNEHTCDLMVSDLGPFFTPSSSADNLHYQTCNDTVSESSNTSVTKTLPNPETRDERGKRPRTKRIKVSGPTRTEGRPMGKVVRSWRVDKVFQRERDALDVIESEKCWTNSCDRTGMTAKAIFGCRNVNSNGSPCDAGVHLQRRQKDSSVTLFRSTNGHTCELMVSDLGPLFTPDSSVDNFQYQNSNDTVSESSNGSATKTLPNPETGDERSKRPQTKRIKVSGPTRTEGKPMEKVVRSWRVDKVFQRERDALDVIESEKCWTNSRERTGMTTKAIFGCRNVNSNGSLCDAGVHLQRSQKDSSVTLFRSTNEHTCDLMMSDLGSLFTPNSSVDNFQYQNSNHTVSESSNRSFTKTLPNPETRDERRKRPQTKQIKVSEPKRTEGKPMKKVVRRWRVDTVFQRERDALDVIESEQCWTNSCERTGMTIKAIYGCQNVNSNGSLCDAGVHLQRSQKDSSVTLFRSTNEHTCDLMVSDLVPLFTPNSSVDNFQYQSCNDTVSESSNRSFTKTLPNPETRDERRKRPQTKRIKVSEPKRTEGRPMEKCFRSWRMDAVFERESAALEVIESEKCWTNSRERTGTNTKAIYGCYNLNPSGSPCDAGVYLQHSQKDSFVTLFRSTNQHTCVVHHSQTDWRGTVQSQNTCDTIESKSCVTSNPFYLATSPKFTSVLPTNTITKEEIFIES